MADVGTLLSVAQTLLTLLQCIELQGIWSLWGYKSELEDLTETVSTIQKVLLDADAKQELSNEAQEWIEKLKDAVYDADDILDEFVTLVELKQQLKESGNLSEKVRDFFSLRNPLAVAYKMSQGVKKIRKKLDRVASNHSKYGFGVGYEPATRRRQETDSSVYAKDVIGREDDAVAIRDMLLSNDVQEDVGFITIFGMGGLGKTTLTKLVYNDETVTNAFSLMMWVCVSDQDEKYFDMKSILGKILESATGDKHDGFSMDSNQRRLREVVKTNKYFLVLDDVWNEDHSEWEKLRSFLRGGGRGSKILVTTRSRRTAEVIRDGHTYELKGLSVENSWRLFGMTAFGNENGRLNSPTLLDIGKKIVKKCVNVPLAIKVVGSLLFGEEENTWLSFQERELANIRKDKNDILSILKLSYHHLEPPLKSCFTYCALFPKDFVIKKDMLLSLWIAQGYVMPFNKGQSIEDAAEDYFSILSRKCFFQDTEVNAYGEIVSCKIHDLMHDVAQDVAGTAICHGNSISNNADKKIRHLFHVGREGTEASFTKNKIRSYLRDGWNSLLPVDTLIANCVHLRSLDLHNLDITSLPKSIGDLLHLRYLDLSWNHDLKTLPLSITRLHNLQTLYLKDCFSLKELPKNLSNLVKLRHLDTIGCKGLTYMPSCMDRLSCLCVLTSFTVAEENSSWKQCVGKLQDLKALTKLKGHLSIWIKANFRYATRLHSEEGHLRRMERLKSVRISWKGEENDQSVDDQEALLEDLQPHPNLRELMLIGYCGLTIPKWGDTLGTFLPNLVRIDFENCHGLRTISSLGKLRNLKLLKLRGLMNLEYIENTGICSSYAVPLTSGSEAAGLTFFPSLKEIILWDLPKLKGWWKMMGSVDDQSAASSSNSSNNKRNSRRQPSCSGLSKLVVGRCPNLISLPSCPTVTTLYLYWINKSLLITIGQNYMASFSPWSRPGMCPSEIKNSDHRSGLVHVDKVPYLKAMPMGCLTRIDITGAENLNSLAEVEELFQTCSSSLRNLTLENCYQLQSLSGGLEHLNALESLVLHYIPNLTFAGEHDQDMPWSSLHQSLRSLDLCHLPQLVNLPQGIHHLTALQTLKIQLCESLEALPGWIGSLANLESLHLIGCDRLQILPTEIRKLTSLRQLEIRHCSAGLKERCQNPDGEDWPKIQFISSVSIT